VTADDEWVLRAHDSVHDRLEHLEGAVIPDELWDTTIELLRKVMNEPDECRTQAIRWPGSDVSGYRVTRRSARYDVQVWWSFVNGESSVWGVLFDPPLDL
jgi:hypothetical protein